MDVIAIDIGNSNISLGVFAKGQLDRTERVAISRPEKLDEILAAFRKICGAQPLGAKTVPVVVSSVNKPMQLVVEEAVDKVLDQRILLIGRDVPLFIKQAVENPEAVGTDRLLTAWAAYSVVEDAVTVADFGTATTIDCVNHQGIFLGGAIMPGLNLAAQTLHEYTAVLPAVKPQIPAGAYGTNTRAAIQHGIIYGAIGALREMVERYATELGRWPQVVITGGYAKLIGQKCDFVDSLVPDLCLDGLFLTYRQFRTSQDEDLDKSLA